MMLNHYNIFQKENLRKVLDCLCLLRFLKTPLLSYLTQEKENIPLYFDNLNVNAFLDFLNLKNVVFPTLARHSDLPALLALFLIRKL